ncbi:MAG: FAD-binding and (Fe-S)-binding domain-containing protein [Marinovum algicola]|uniref:FAD/FMN-containing dehydrogenase n=1 Tax=Marinovum algicola TaxID=42444 RepID=A0A975WDB4_9RHOB|nr:FAD-binding and (Fe-S)-binding domain-containing protein [Marinovum algicola]SEJ99862.1 FAD/FMN-containing dehydrogenase [Marinovum algicola]SLN73365.1 putative FAD-linked oxidoreductase [Marinovum algicola]
MSELPQTGDGAAVAIEALDEALRQAGFRGALDGDSALREAMSTDNSVYRICPDLVAAPCDAADMAVLVAVMHQPRFRAIPLTARGGGTGTNGQSLNRGVVVDTRRHMHRLLALDAEAGWADVEPGLVLDDLNAQIRDTGWFFAPETSTSTRCTIGGMVSTDASGKGSRVYGKTSDNLVGLEIARPEGLLWSGDPAPDWARPMLAEAGRAARDGRAAFVAATPALNRRFTGYDLERACTEPGGFDWWRLFPGAEGTLGLISRIRVRLRRIEAEKRLILAGFDGFRAALSAAVPLARGAPTAVEVMDARTQGLAADAGLLDALPEALRAPDIAPVFIEVNGTGPEEVEARVAAIGEILASLPGLRATHLAAGRDEIRRLWAVRSAGVGLLGRTEGRARPVAFVEDAVVPPENLAGFLDDFLATLDGFGLNYGIYGHADVGCLHVRPALDIDRDADRAILQKVSDAVFALTRKHGGIFWGEHGKGVRGAYLRDWIGDEAYAALQGVKAAFDPEGRYNPGKLVAPPERLMGITTTPFRPFNAPEGDPLDKAFRCNGNAQCLSYAAATPMCPSFKASADLRHSPKGRADALRAWHGARDSAPPAELARREAELHAVLDTCLGCKACATSCPVQVDIPEMRSRFLADYHRRHRRGLTERLTLLAERASPLALRLAPVVAPLWPLLRPLAERLTATTDLPPRLARRLAPELYLRDNELAGSLPEGSVILAQDWFTALFDAAAQRQAVAGLRALGYSPRLLPLCPGGKAAHGAGDLPGFRRLAGRLAAHLRRAAATGAPILALDPAFGMMLRQEYPKAGIRVPAVLMPQEFLAEELARGQAFPQAGQDRARLLGHCTEVTANPQSARQWRQVFAALGVALETPDTGCCGMAGLFGHQARHQRMSRDLFALSWRDQVDAPCPTAACGFSCRSQGHRLAGRDLLHPLGLIAAVLAPAAAARHPG